MASQHYGAPISAPACPPVQGAYPQRPGEQDCRDYLRTGRCKYGESCKYNHPPGVQSGGGMKAPEGGFPFRPSESPCQYYLKHGTCKFGQTCKFHHPPQVMTSGGVLPAGAVLMNVGGLGGQHVIALNDGSGMGEMQQVVQLLPQRPGEPDCIYFLRNGRCKYGATCKYHHPLTNAATSRPQSKPHHADHTYGSQRINTRGRSPSFGSTQDSYGGHQQGTYGQRNAQLQVDQPTHFLVSDGSFQAVTLRPPSGHYTNPGASNGSSPGVAPSSLASSYETASSSLQDYRGYSQQHEEVAVDSSGRVWRRTTSGDHLSSFGGQRPSSQEHLHSMGRRIGSQERMPRVPSRGPPVEGGSMLPRHESHGSFVSARMSNVPPSPGGTDSDLGSRSQHSMSSLQRAAAGSGGGYHPSYSQQQQQQVESDRSWTSSGSANYGPSHDFGVPRSGSGAYLNTNAPQQFVLEEDEESYDRQSSSSPRHAGNGHSSNGHPSRSKSQGEGDGDGLSSMTSALLNMLDTTDRDASGRDDDYSQSASSHGGSKLSPDLSSKSDARSTTSPQHRLSDDNRGIDHPSQHQQQQQRSRYQPASSMSTHVEDYEPSFLSHSLHSDDDDDGGPPTPVTGVHTRTSNHVYGPPPGWGGGRPQARGLESNAQSVSMLQSSQHQPPPPPPGGFYLP